MSVMKQAPHKKKQKRTAQEENKHGYHQVGTEHERTLETANGGGLISNRFNPYNTPGLKLPKRKDQE